MRRSLGSLLVALVVAVGCAGESTPVAGNRAPASTATPTTSTAAPDIADHAELVDDAVGALDGGGWWDFADEFLGLPLSASATRHVVASDVLDVCEFLGDRPSGFDDLLDELNRVSERRAAAPGTRFEPLPYALVIDTALPRVCPDEAALADTLRPRLQLAPRDLLTSNVPDPRPGDLRIDAEADVLPSSYHAPPAPTTILDIPYGDDPEQQLDLHLPAEPGAPVVLFVHSGGWVAGDKSVVPDMVMRFVERGYAVASVGWRLAPRHTFPTPLEDIKHAVRWLKAYGEREGLVDGERIIAYGVSAGGHLAALLATTPGRFEPTDLAPAEAAHDSSIAGLVSAVGPTDLVTFYRQPHPWATEFTEALLGCSPCTDDVLAEASPANHLGPDLPPAYWAYGREDHVLVEPTTQGAAIAAAWVEQAGIYSSWYDLVDEQAHHLDQSTVNQRYLETFMDLIARPDRSPAGASSQP